MTAPANEVIRYSDHVRLPAAALHDGRLERLLDALEIRFCQEGTDWLTDVDETMAEIGRAYLGLNIEDIHEDLQPLVLASASDSDSDLQVRHDMHGWYICTAEEAEFEDAGHASVGFDGRRHYQTPCAAHIEMFELAKAEAAQ